MVGLKNMLKRYLINKTPLFIKYDIINKYLKDPKVDLLSYSQEGEDKILDRFLEGRSKGFYVDVGAHHPTRYSNTYLFYNRGWRGINIDAMPGSMESFLNLRPHDINLEIPISSKIETLPFYVFNSASLNTFSKVEAEKKHGWKNFKLIKTIEIQAFPLSDILDKYLPKGQKIDFMTIDVEGYDLKVLESNNWEKYKPNYILVESLNNCLENIKEDAVYIYLRRQGYEIVAKSYNTLFFKELNQVIKTQSS